GDEFAAVLMGADATVAEKVGERMRKRFDGGERFGTSFSVGVAQYEDGMDGESFVRLADRALYCAKASGKDVTCVA
ncbi:MAG: diguanylate cyclase, partial [Candidatus Hydrogenedentes bacterium]|nr:diguanylate cyclase [Candidatus Hydrogenedentota bacterium]